MEHVKCSPLRLVRFQIREGLILTRVPGKAFPKWFTVRAVEMGGGPEKMQGAIVADINTRREIYYFWLAARAQATPEL